MQACTLTDLGNREVFCNGREDKNGQRRGERRSRCEALCKSTASQKCTTVGGASTIAMRGETFLLLPVGVSLAGGRKRKKGDDGTE